MEHRASLLQGCAGEEHLQPQCLHVSASSRQKGSMLQQRETNNGAKAQTQKQEKNQERDESVTEGRGKERSQRGKVSPGKTSGHSLSCKCSWLSSPRDSCCLSSHVS